MKLLFIAAALALLIGCSPSGHAPDYTDPLTGMEFVRVEGGCYMMGDAFGDGELDERPVHRVCLDEFRIGRFEVTQAQWIKVMGENPSEFACPDCPVEGVSWIDAQEFIEKLNLAGGGGYRLPTEAEWEYAARSGGRKERFAGTSDASKIGEFAWHDANSGGRTHPAGQKKPNGLGLYDMSGNVWEWASDCYGEGYYLISPVGNPKGPETCTSRVLRGGSWYRDPADLRASLRSTYKPDIERSSFGLRLVRTD